MPDARFHPSLDFKNASFAGRLIDRVFAAIDPGRTLRTKLDSVRHNHPTHILAVGKASVAMTHAAIEHLGPRFARATVITSDEIAARNQFKNKFVELLVGDHPLPGARSLESTLKLIEHARSIPKDHHVLVLISGGTSAMLCGIESSEALDQLVAQTDQLMRAGASIHELNAMRSKLDPIKLGGLAKHLGQLKTEQIRVYLLGDVIEQPNAPLESVIGSGPMWAPTRASKIEHMIIADNHTALDALCAYLAGEGIGLSHIKRRATGFASDEGAQLAQALLASDNQVPCAVCLGGEPTVRVGNNPGIGGPMLELAASAAVELNGAEFPWTVISLATDGVDGPSGVAGAVLAHDMLRDPDAIGQLKSAIERHETLGICDQLGATIRTGHTGTNVNDLAIAIHWPSNHRHKKTDE
tara:strand:+ start:112051 stop:113286 length:1236 start_codon:yes stop_codon:yes gene_type:complete